MSGLFLSPFPSYMVVAKSLGGEWESGSAFLPPSMEGELGTFEGPEKRVVEVPLQPLAWVGLVAIYCRHLLTRQRISLATVELVRGVS